MVKMLTQMKDYDKHFLTNLISFNPYTKNFRIYYCPQLPPRMKEAEAQRG